jgi:hypothetical protein
MSPTERDPRTDPKLGDDGYCVIQFRVAPQEIISRWSVALELMDKGHLSSRREYHKTYDELKASLHDKPCVECGGVITLGWLAPIPDRLRERCICHGCDLWTGKAEEQGPHVVVVRGTRYTISPDIPGNRFAGFGGSRFEIEFLDGRTVVSHNLWFNGEVPAHFRKRIPDNARFILRETIACRHCEKFFDLVIDQTGYSEWKKGKRIQHALPELKERELLISQTCDVCWEELFKEEEELGTEDVNY